jgi:hypothetical protein
MFSKKVSVLCENKKLTYVLRRKMNCTFSILEKEKTCSQKKHPLLQKNKKLTYVLRRRMN